MNVNYQRGRMFFHPLISRTCHCCNMIVSWPNGGWVFKLN